MLFSTLSLLVAVGSAAFSLAAPVSPVSNALEARCLCEDVGSILTTVTETLKVVLEPFHYVSAENCTAEYVTPVVQQCNSALNTAISQVQAISKNPTSTILTGADGVVLTVYEVAELICALLTVVFTALCAVLKVVTAVEYGGVSVLLCEVVVLVAKLLELVCLLLDGVVAIVIKLLADVLIIVIAVICKLGLTGYYSWFPVSWSSVSTSYFTETAYTSATTLYHTSVATYTAVAA